MLVILSTFFLAAAGILLYVYPVPTDAFFARVHPAQSYQEALELIEVMKRSDLPPIHRSAYTQALLHGHKTEKAIVFLHGLTNTPRQFAPMADEFFKRGYNVFIPRFPYHGNEDPLAPDVARLTAAEMIAFSDSVMNIATGLGEDIRVAGLSMGGTITAWLAQSRPDIETAIIIAPLLNPALIPHRLWRPAITLLNLLPNRFLWWDPELGARLECPAGVYTQFSTRVIASLMHIGWVVKEKAQKEAPQAERIVFIMNAHDTAINRATVDELFKLWECRRGDSVSLFEFPAGLELDHDIIDPEQFPEVVQVVYPELIRHITDTERKGDFL